MPERNSTPDAQQPAESADNTPTKHIPHEEEEDGISMNEAQHTEDSDHLFEESDSDLPPLPPTDDADSFLQQQPTELQDSNVQSDTSTMSERIMKRKLMDIESSFLPDPAPVDRVERAAGADDTYLFAGTPGRASGNFQHLAHNGKSAQNTSIAQMLHHNDPSSPPTPEGAYKTPFPIRQHSDVKSGAESGGDGRHRAQSSEVAPSSPSAAAAARSKVRDGPVQGNNSQHDGQPYLQVNQGLSTAHSDDFARPVSSSSTVNTLKGLQDDGKT
ncbi:hypothetical protein LTS18_006758, partial [Coniosporium uncinatum]